MCENSKLINKNVHINSKKALKKEKVLFQIRNRKRLRKYKKKGGWNERLRNRRLQNVCNIRKLNVFKVQGRTYGISKQPYDRSYRSSKSTLLRKHPYIWNVLRRCCVTKEFNEWKETKDVYQEGILLLFDHLAYEELYKNYTRERTYGNSNARVI